MSDRIEKLAKAYGPQRRKEMPPEHPFKYQDGIELAELLDLEFARACRLAAAWGAAEASKRHTEDDDGTAS